VKKVVESSMKCINLLVSRYSDADFLKNFRARARSVPADVAVHGITYALTVLAARSNYRAIEVGLIASECVGVVERVREVLKDASSEELSYGAYGAVVVYVMKSAGMIKSNNFKELIEETLRDPLLRLKARMVFEWVKRFSEAYIPSGGSK